MPQTYNTLRCKFMKDGSDGILEAETILKEGGYLVNQGVITLPTKFDLSKHTYGEFVDAAEFLAEEWDYSHG